MPDFERGDQIVYIPNHADGDPNHAACERGFVTRAGRLTVHCRFWHRESPGVLRTTANSERAMVYNLKRAPGYVPQKLVNAWLTIIDWENS